MRKVQRKKNVVVYNLPESEINKQKTGQRRRRSLRIIIFFLRNRNGGYRTEIIDRTRKS